MRALDTMADSKNAHAASPSEWQPTVSGDAGLTLSAPLAGKSQALRMDFDFKSGGGFVVAKRVMQRAMPEEYAVRYRLRGRGAPIQLELKLADPSGRNVWRHVTPDLHLPASWRHVRVESRDIEFAWGPAGGGGISGLGSLEIAVVCREAATGTLWIADLEIVDTRPPQPPTAYASSELHEFGALQALEGKGWKARPEDRRPWLVIDSGAPRRLGGLVIDWVGRAPVGGFRVSGSNNAVRWKTLYDAPSAGGERSYVYLPGAQVRFLRLAFKDPAVGAFVRLQSFEFSRSIDAFWYHIAAAEPRGWHPRWLHREQTVWTPIGIASGTQCALINGDGMVEVAQGSFSLEPMLWIAGRLVTWADVTPRQVLESDYLPVPTVIWERAQWSLSIHAEMTQAGVVRVRYELRNLAAEPANVRLFLLVRPYQVTPPWQSFRGLGGVSSVHDVTWRDGVMCVNERLQLATRPAPSDFGSLRFDDGFMAESLRDGSLPSTRHSHDDFGYLTAALEFALAIPGHGSQECAVTTSARFDATPRYDWARHLPVTQWSGTGWMKDALQTALTATAHILITRSGPALHPGPRRYTRSWIRDGAMMGAALLRMGHAPAVRDFIEWYAPYQRADGFVPCLVDALGVDWLVEHDSHGQLIALIADYFRFTADLHFLEGVYVHVDKAVGYIERSLETGGLMPISVSHEGYLAQPVHSYWDDFWTLRGLRDAVTLARAMKLGAQAQAWEVLCTRFATALFASIESTRAQRHLDFIPGSVEWADFDPTATANALYLFDVLPELNRQAVERTFDVYLAEWQRKRHGSVDWANYTPYEIRIIGALVRLGRRAAALELLRFFLSDRRPARWNQWPEIAWRDQRAPAHVGDLPHTWISAEYVLALRSMIAYERESDASVILAAGLAAEWLEAPGVRVEQMPTLYGNLSYSLQQLDSQTLRFDIGVYPRPLVLRPPLAAPLRSVTIDGQASMSFDAGSVTLPHGPAQVICSL
jgi:hypothetical protein